MITTKHQISETEKEILRMTESGMIKLSLSDYSNMLLDMGLKLDLQTDSYLFKYYNTSNKYCFLCATTSPIELTSKYSCFNIHSNFYKNEILKRTDKYYTLKHFRNNYFCVLPSMHILTI